MNPVIAIVDDDRAVREALQRMLGSYGFAAAVFASAEEFLAAERHSASCLILDVRMPGMNGFALHRQLVADNFRIPTILITARPTSSEQDQAAAAGIVAYLAKPLGEEALLDTVREALQDCRDAAVPDAAGG